MKFTTAAERSDYAFSVLTPAVKALYRKAIHETNLQILEDHNKYAKQYQFASADRRGLSGNLRFFLMRNLQTAFASFEQSTFRKLRGGFLYQQLFRTHIVRFNKADFPDTVVQTSPIFEIYHDVALPLVFDESDDCEPDISGLFPLLARFLVKEDNTITDWYFNDQEGNRLVSTERLDLLPTVVSINSDELAVDGTSPFKWKGTDIVDRGNQAKGDTG